MISSLMKKRKIQGFRGGLLSMPRISRDLTYDSGIHKILGFCAFSSKN